MFDFRCSGHSLEPASAASQSFVSSIDGCIARATVAGRWNAQTQPRPTILSFRSNTGIVDFSILINKYGFFMYSPSEIKTNHADGTPMRILPPSLFCSCSLFLQVITVNELVVYLHKCFRTLFGCFQRTKILIVLFFFFYKLFVMIDSRHRFGFTHCPHWKQLVNVGHRSLSLDCSFRAVRGCFWQRPAHKNRRL